jgi:hypothetical protein
MKTNDPWKKLSDAARRRSRTAAPPSELPWGFESAVLARLRDRRPSPAELWLRMAWRLVPAGAAVFLACWIAVRPTPASCVTSDSHELTELLIEEALPQ